MTIVTPAGPTFFCAPAQRTARSVRPHVFAAGVEGHKSRGYIQHVSSVIGRHRQQGGACASEVRDSGSNACLTQTPSAAAMAAPQVPPPERSTPVPGAERAAPNLITKNGTALHSVNLRAGPHLSR